MEERDIEQVVLQASVVAVYGMRDEAHADAPAYQIPRMLQERGYRIRPVNPKIASSLGEKAYASMADLPEAPDILDVFRRSEAIPALADEVLALPLEKRPKTVWLQSGITHPEAEARLEAAGMKVVSDRCLGVYAARLKPKA